MEATVTTTRSKVDEQLGPLVLPGAALSAQRPLRSLSSLRSLRSLSGRVELESMTRSSRLGERPCAHTLDPPLFWLYVCMT